MKDNLVGYVIRFKNNGMLRDKLIAIIKELSPIYYCLSYSELYIYVYIVCSNDVHFDKVLFNFNFASIIKSNIFTENRDYIKNNGILHFEESGNINKMIST